MENVENQTTGTGTPAPTEHISNTGSKMGAEPQALPDDPVSSASHPLPSSGKPVQQGLNASEIFERQHQGEPAGTVKSDTQAEGEVGAVMDEKISPDLSQQH